MCLQGLPAVVAILQVPAYQTALLEGLAASIGGLDSSLSKAASAAVLRLVEQHPSSGERQGAASAFFLSSMAASSLTQKPSNGDAVQVGQTAPHDRGEAAALGLQGFCQPAHVVMQAVLLFACQRPAQYVRQKLHSAALIFSSMGMQGWQTPC